MRGRIERRIKRTHQGFKLLGRNQVEFRDEEVEVLVAGVDVGFHADGDESVKVVDVHVDKDAEESGQDFLADGDKVSGKGDIRLGGEDVLRVDLPFDPVHQVGDVLHRRQDCRLLVLDPICPQVLVPESQTETE